MTTTCSAPVPFETLVALWAGDLGAEAADAVEEHLFSCELCTAASDRLGQLVTGLRELIPPVLSHARRDKLAAAGVRLRQTPVDSGVDVDAHFTRDVDLLVHVLKGDLSRADRVDVEIVDEQGNPLMQLPHVPFDPGRGEVLIACQRHYETMEGMPQDGDPVFRVYAIEGGARREVGSYLVRHHFH